MASAVMGFVSKSQVLHWQCFRVHIHSTLKISSLRLPFSKFRKFKRPVCFYQACTIPFSSTYLIPNHQINTRYKRYISPNLTSCVLVAHFQKQRKYYKIEQILRCFRSFFYLITIGLINTWHLKHCI